MDQDNTNDVPTGEGSVEESTDATPAVEPARPAGEEATDEVATEDEAPEDMAEEAPAHDPMDDMDDDEE